MVRRVGAGEYPVIVYWRRYVVERDDGITITDGWDAHLNVENDDVTDANVASATMHGDACCRRV